MIIRTENLTRIYRTDEVETTSLHQVNLNIEQGEFVAIMGPSGCGKSTLLNLIGLLDTPDAGEYYFNGKAAAHLPEREKAILRKEQIGFIFQSFNLIDDLTVFENIELPLLYLGMSSSQRKSRVEEVMQRLEVSHRANHYPQQLSGGQQQRVAVCRAIATEPSLILADEPTGNLDSKNGEEVMRILSDLNASGSTVVMVTHSSEHAAFAGRVIHLFDGKIVSENIKKMSYVQA
ncbi:MAG: ABC transporter ATP-binding protein [Bacteroidetes bacterium]|nr:ABC transporter ATP-binding protein [Bacteroidota bacterium]